jgi:hypothetical protein
LPSDFRRSHIWNFRLFGFWSFSGAWSLGFEAFPRMFVLRGQTSCIDSLSVTARWLYASLSPFPASTEVTREVRADWSSALTIPIDPDRGCPQPQHERRFASFENSNRFPARLVRLGTAVVRHSPLL